MKNHSMYCRILDLLNVLKHMQPRSQEIRLAINHQVQQVCLTLVVI